MKSTSQHINQSGRCSSAGGFTIIELLVTLTVIAVLAAISAPYFRDVILANQTTRFTNDLVQALYAARIEAVKQTVQISVSALDSSSASNEWGPGLVVYEDANLNSAYDSGEVVVRRLSAIEGNQTIDGPDGTSTFNFMPNGGISLASITFTVCDSRTGEVGRSVTVSSRGQVRAGETSCS